MARDAFCKDDFLAFLIFPAGKELGAASQEEGKANQTCRERETNAVHVGEVGQVQRPCLLREGIEGGVSTSAVIM